MSNVDKLSEVQLKKLSEVQIKYRKMDKLIEFFKMSGMSIKDLERAIQDIKAVYKVSDYQEEN